MSDVKMFIVKHGPRHFGPFLQYEAEHYAKGLSNGDASILPLTTPRSPSEKRTRTFRILNDAQARAHEDSFRVDTLHVIPALLWALFYARDEERVLTASEIMDLWKNLFTISQAVRSLMHHVERVIESPTNENVQGLKKAFWRNRGSDDVDPHYHDRFW